MENNDKNLENKNFKELDDTVILYPHDYINDIEGEKLEEMCDSFLAKGVKKVVIDFSGTEMVNSIGVSILIGVIERIKDKKGVILFSGLKKVNRDIFDIVGLTKLIPIFGSEDDAINELSDIDTGSTV